MIKKINLQIEYIVISDGSSLESVYLPPDIFQYQILNYLKNLPKNIFQLIDAIKYYEFQLKSSLNEGYDLKVVNIKDWEILKNIIRNTVSVRLFFINGDSEKQAEILNDLISDKNKLDFFSYYKKKGTIENERIIDSPFDFLNKMITNQKIILESLGLKTNSIELSVPIEFSKIVSINYFLPVRNNIYTINNSIGNFFFPNIENDNEDEIKKKHGEISSLALKEKETFNRQEVFNQQLDNIDALIKIAYKENLIVRVSGIEPVFPPVIIAAPFHNPDFKSNDKALDYALTLEQTSNYTIDSNTSKSSLEMTLMAMQYHKIRLNYLDDLSYLHSSFTFSPSLRLPIKGKSLYRELSFFGPKSFASISKPNSRKKLLKSISKFGEKFADLTINLKTQKILKVRNSQIISISDLPIEWLTIDNIPLSFTHDICRIPETSMHGLMSHYVTSQNFKFSINRNIIKNTLIILGCQDAEFTRWHNEVFRLQTIFEFHVEICDSVEHVKSAVEKHRPDFLIFDCHGGIDTDSNSTYLIIGDEKLDSKKIVNNNISAPLVLLSACGTAPTYGTMNPIANAFFELGALSVTSTFLPISVDGGSILYLRLLNKLNHAANGVIHKNWLEFMSHIIRTSTINDAYLTVLKKNEEINLSEFNHSNVRVLTDSLQFEKRRQLYITLDKKISQMTKDDYEYYSSIIPEYLLYTNLGRSDLILFDTWLEENNNKNVN